MWKVLLFRGSSCLMHYSVDCVFLPFFLFLVFAFPFMFHACSAHSDIPHRQNNYYYESDPGQETLTTIATSFLLPISPLVICHHTHRNRSWTSHTENSRGLFYSRLCRIKRHGSISCQVHAQTERASSGPFNISNGQFEDTIII